MSRPRYIWWPYIKAIIRRYPEFSTKPNKSEVECKECDAVSGAIEATKRLDNGLDRLKVIRLVLWDETHTLDGAALTVPCGECTARRWHGDFIRLTAKLYGLMD
jgi:hypothetical protein